MKNIRIYKGFIIGMSAFALFPNVAGCSKETEVVETKTVEEETPDWVEKRKKKEDKEFTKEEVEKAAIDAFQTWADDIENSFNELNNSETAEKAKEKIATNFINMTDVLFYGKAIEYGDGKTVTVSDLGEGAKEKLELIYSTIDSKIESYWPNYMEEIESKASLGLGYISDKANSLKLYLLDKASEHMTEEDYEKAGEYWDMFKEQSKKDFESGKDLLKDLWNKGTDFADDKYQDFKKETEEKYK